MSDRATRDQMVSNGWLAEGDGPDLVVVCAPPLRAVETNETRTRLFEIGLPRPVARLRASY